MYCLNASSRAFIAVDAGDSSSPAHPVAQSRLDRLLRGHPRPPASSIFFIWASETFIRSEYARV